VTNEGSLETLPYDTGVFDMVHLRFLALGVPEAKWSDLLDECARVLKPGGRLEIVETSLILPSTSPASLRNSFASMLLADLIEPVPSLALKFSIPLSGCFMSTGTTPVFERAWAQGEAPDALGDVVMGWVKSAMEYKGTGLRKGARQEGMVERVKRELEKAGGGRWRWSFGLEAEGKVGPDVTENEGRDVREVQKEGRVEEGQAEGVSVWAWVLTKR
jgi:SAM-dependent methyltransferase